MLPCLYLGHSCTKRTLQLLPSGSEATPHIYIAFTVCSGAGDKLQNFSTKSILGKNTFVIHCVVVYVLLQEVLLRSPWQLARQENCMRSG